jgi:hypothetical protein
MFPSLLARSRFLDVEAVAGTQKKTGGDCGHSAEKPEQEKSDAVGTDPANIDKNHAWVERGEEKNCRYTCRDKRRPHHGNYALYYRDVIQHISILH